MACPSCPSSEEETAVESLARWLDSEDCTYAGMRDRLILGHHAMSLASGLPTFASYSAKASAHRFAATTVARLREAERALEEERAASEGSRRALEEERAASEEARRSLDEAHLALEAARASAEAALRTERSAYDQALRTERDRLTDERAQMATHHAEVLSRLADVAEARGRLETREAEARARVDAREAEARAKAEAREAEAHARLEARLAGMHSDEVRRLRAELDRLRGTNHVKGVEGEAAVAAAMRAAFDAWTFMDTSSKGGESDFHMVSPAGETLVVEVKNKASVTAGDVSKSQRDVAELHDRLGNALIGYLFVSLRSRAIPGKGSAALEVSSSSSVPVMWCGLEGAESSSASLVACIDEDGRARDVVRAARLLIDVGRALASRRSPPLPVRTDEDPSGSRTAIATVEAESARLKMEADLADAVTLLNSQLEQVDGMRRIASRLTESAGTTRRHAVAMQAAVDSAFRGLDAHRIRGAAAAEEDEHQDASASVPPPNVAVPNAAAAAITCTLCNRVFLSRPGLATHARTCIVKNRGV